MIYCTNPTLCSLTFKSQSEATTSRHAMSRLSLFLEQVVFGLRQQLMTILITNLTVSCYLLGIRIIMYFFYLLGPVVMTSFARWSLIYLIGVIQLLHIILAQHTHTKYIYKSIYFFFLMCRKVSTKQVPASKTGTNAN